MMTDRTDLCEDDCVATVTEPHEAKINSSLMRFNENTTHNLAHAHSHKENQNNANNNNSNNSNNNNLATNVLINNNDTNYYKNVATSSCGGIDERKRKNSMTIDESLLDAVEDAPPGLLLFVQRNQNHGKRYSNNTTITTTTTNTMNTLSMCALSHDRTNSNSISKQTFSCIDESRAFTSFSKSSINVHHEALEEAADVPNTEENEQLLMSSKWELTKIPTRERKASTSNQNVVVCDEKLASSGHDANEQETYKKAQENFVKENVKDTKRNDKVAHTDFVLLQQTPTVEFIEMPLSSPCGQTTMHDTHYTENQNEEQLTLHSSSSSISSTSCSSSCSSCLSESPEKAPLTTPNKALELDKTQNKPHDEFHSFTWLVSSSFSMPSTDNKLEKSKISLKVAEKPQQQMVNNNRAKEKSTKTLQEVHTPTQRRLINNLKHKETTPVMLRYSTNHFTRTPPHALSLTSYMHVANSEKPRSSQDNLTLIRLSDNSNHNNGRINKKWESKTYSYCGQFHSCNHFHKDEEDWEEYKEKEEEEYEWELEEELYSLSRHQRHTYGGLWNVNVDRNNVSFVNHTPDSLSLSSSLNAIDQLQEAGWYRWPHTHLEASLSARVHSSQTSHTHLTISSPPMSQVTSSRNEVLMIPVRSVYTNSDSSHTTPLEVAFPLECSLRKSNVSGKHKLLSHSFSTEMLYSDVYTDNMNNIGSKNSGNISNNSFVHKKWQCPIISTTPTRLCAESDINDTYSRNNNSMPTECATIEIEAYEELYPRSNASLSEITVDAEMQIITELISTQSSTSNKLGWSAAHRSTSGEYMSFSNT